MRPTQSGFTLIEVMLATAITGILFTGLFMTVSGAAETRNALANHTTPYVLGPAILDLLANDLANAYFYDIKDTDVFLGANAELNGREADALSFLASSKTNAPEEFEKNDLRESWINELSYVMRRGPGGTDFLELWRREDFYVDDHPHSDGEFLLVYDKVHSLSIQYVARNPMTEGGVSGPEEKSEEDMLQEDWNSVEEGGVPRALQITLKIFAKSGIGSVEEAAERGEAEIYTFQRFITLPQSWLSIASEGQIRDWDGKLREPAASAAPGSAAAAAAAGRGGGAGGGGAEGERPRGGRGGRRNQGGTGTPGAAGNLTDIFRGRGGGRPAGGGGANIGGIFGGLGGR